MGEDWCAWHVYVLAHVRASTDTCTGTCYEFVPRHVHGHSKSHVCACVCAAHMPDSHLKDVQRHVHRHVCIHTLRPVRQDIHALQHECRHVACVCVLQSERQMTIWDPNTMTPFTEVRPARPLLPYFAVARPGPARPCCPCWDRRAAKRHASSQLTPAQLKCPHVPRVRLQMSEHMSHAHS